MPFVHLFQQLNFSSPTWDLFIILFFVVFAFLYGFSLGRDRIIVIIVGIYMALAVVSTAPWLKAIEGATVHVALEQYFAFRVTLFIGVFLLTFFLLSRSALMGTIGSVDTHGPISHIILFSILHVGLLISVTLSFLPASVAAEFAPVTRAVFLSDVGRSLWITLPIVAMVLTRRPKAARS